MTCDRSATTVSAELSGLDHVTEMAVNLATGAVTIASATEVSRSGTAVALAVSGHRWAD